MTLTSFLQLSNTLARLWSVNDRYFPSGHPLAGVLRAGDVGLHGNRQCRDEGATKPMTEIARVSYGVHVARSLLILHAHALRYGYYGIAEEYVKSAKRWTHESVPRLEAPKRKGEPPK